MIGGGILALWNDCKASHEDAYEAWYQGEHLAERLAVPGFRRGRRMQGIADGPGYFTYYETVGPDVLFSLVYRQLLDHPSPETERIMRETFRNMSRTVCRVARRDGAVYGGYVVTVKLVDEEVDGPVWLFVDGLANRSDVARTEIWTAVEPPKGAISREETLRGGDDTIATCLLVETLRERPALDIVDQAREQLANASSAIGIYRLLCDLQSDG